MSATLFTNAKIIDGSGEAAFQGDVLVAGNRIKTVSREAGALSPDGADIVDCAGATLMPGMVCAHCHTSFANTSTLEALGEIPTEEHILLSARNAKTYLDHGFTSVNSMASAKSRLDIVIRNAINNGEIPGPRMLAASPELTVSSGLGDVRLLHMKRDSFAIICDGADEFRREARIMVREGVDTLKINPSGDEFVPHAKAEHTVMTEDEIAAVADVGHAVGLRIAAHARSAKSVKLSVKHGIQLINHATFADEEAKDMLEEAKDWVFVMPTLGITYATAYEAGDWGITPEVAEQIGMPREFRVGSENMKDLKQRGVRVLPGGDYGFAWNPTGHDARDLVHMVEHMGFTPMEALVSITKWGGELMMLPGELGLIRDGALADLLLVDGDPLKDLAVLQDPDKLRAIMKDGAFHKALDRHSAGVQQAAE